MFEPSSSFASERLGSEGSSLTRVEERSEVSVPTDAGDELRFVSLDGVVASWMGDSCGQVASFEY